MKKTHSSFLILFLAIVLASFIFTGCVFSVNSDDLLGRHFTWTSKTSETQENYTEEVYEFYEDGTYTYAFIVQQKGRNPNTQVYKGTYTTGIFVKLTETKGYFYDINKDGSIKKSDIPGYTPSTTKSQFTVKKDDYGKTVLVNALKTEYIGYPATEKLKY